MCADRLKRLVKAGEQLTVDYRCFNFENGCLCLGCTGLTTYDESDYATAVGRICAPDGLNGGLITKRCVAIGIIVGFDVGRLLPVAEAQGQEILGNAQVKVVRRKPPWVLPAAWNDSKGQQYGAVIDSRHAEVSVNPARRIYLHAGN